MRHFLCFEELSDDTKERAKDILIEMISANIIPKCLRFDEKGNVNPLQNKNM